MRISSAGRSTGAVQGGGTPAGQTRQPILVSVIIPSYNQGQFIEDTIFSILRQDYDHLEVLIIDAASKDNTLEILRRFGEDPRVRWLSEPDNGPNSAFNKGLRLAKGDVCAFQTSSDIYLQGAIGSAMAEFEADAGLAFVGASVQVIDTSGRATSEQWRVERRAHLTIEDVVSFRGYPGVQASFFKRDIALAVGGMDETLQSCHTIFFLAYFLEALRRGSRVLAVPEFWGTFREHSSHRNARVDIKGIPYCRERHEACRINSDRFKNFLSQDHLMLLRRSPYLFELERRVIHEKQLLRSIPTVLGAVRFGARLPDFMPLIATIGSRLRTRFEGKRNDLPLGGEDMRWYSRAANRKTSSGTSV